MRWFAWAMAVVMAGGGALLMWAANRPHDGAYFEAATRHDPTLSATEKAARLELEPARAFDLPAVAAGSVSLATLHARGPAVLVFIKHTCPCSIEAEPVFAAFARAWRRHATFAGIIDCAGQEAQIYKQSNLVGYNLLQDPWLTTMEAYGAETSLHVVLVGADGKVVQAWPGYSKTMLRELNMRLARETGIPPREFDDRLAPDRLTAGCRFEPPAGGA